MQDLKDVTNRVHYENYRCQKLAGVINSPDPKHAQFQAPSRLATCSGDRFSTEEIELRVPFIDTHPLTSAYHLPPTHTPPPPHLLHPCRDPIAQFEVEKREHEVKMRKMEQEMEEVFEMKVQEKLQKLKDIEADVSWREKGHRRDKCLGGSPSGWIACLDIGLCMQWGLTHSRRR